MIEIAQRGKPPSGRSPDDTLAAAEEEVKRIRTEALEQALAAEAAELANETGITPAGRVLRRIPYRGVTLAVRVPQLKQPDGTLRFPPLFEGLKESASGILELLEAGVSTRDVSGILKVVLGENVRGASRSNVSRAAIDAGEADLEAVNTRRFEEPVVAVSLDGTAIGTRGKKRTVMIATGVSASGRKLVLGVCVAQHEREEDVYQFLKGLVERGISRDVLWTVDRGSGIEAALKRLGAPHRQLCTTHVARNVAAELPEELQEPFRLRLYESWGERTAGEALRKLEAIAVELQESGYEGAATTLRNAMDDTVTVQRLGLVGQLRRQLRSTNGIESVNSSVKAALKMVTIWRHDSMRLRWAAKRLLELERKSWRRLAEPRSLVRLMEQLVPGRHDPAAILAELPPDLAVEKVPVALDEAGQLEERTTQIAAAATGASWVGSPEALRILGVAPGAAVAPAELERALQGNHATEAGKAIRDSAQIAVWRPDENGLPRKQKVRGVLSLQWQLRASPRLMEEWSAAPPERRAELERGLGEAALAALEVVTSTTQPSHGFATTATPPRLLPRPDGGTELVASGIAVGVVRGKGEKLRSPAAGEALGPATARDGEDAAKAALDATLERVAAQARAPAPPLPEQPSGALLAGVEERALERAAEMVALEPEELRAIAGEEELARADLDLVGGEATAWWAANREAAAWEVAAARRQPGASEQGLWRPLGRAARLVLGERRAQLLRGDAAHLLGRAEVDGALSEALAKRPASRPLAELDTAAARVDRLAGAIAARRDLDRRAALESARARAEAGDVGPATIPISDSRGRLAAPPAKRFAHALGHRAEWFARYSEAVAAKLKGEDQAVLGNLLERIGTPWAELDTTSGYKHGRLEARRDALLAEWLKRRYECGRAAERSARAEAGKDVSALYAAAGEAEVGEKLATGLWQELRAIEAQLDGYRAERGGPEPERFARQHPEAATYDAVIVEAQRRALAEQQMEQTAAALDLSQAGLDLAP